jgi:hypothetical protein
MKNQKSMRTIRKGMQSYVDYLLEDIQNAEGNVEESPNPLSCNDDPLDHFMEIERMVIEDPLNTFGEICGLTIEQFPPFEKLSIQQVKKIVKAFYKLLHSWNLDVIIPKKFPQAERYNLLIPLLDRKTHILKKGIGYIEFCEYEPKYCPFGSWCDCKDLLDERFNPGENKRPGKTKTSSH